MGDRQTNAILHAMYWTSQMPTFITTDEINDIMRKSEGAAKLVKLKVVAAAK